MLLYYFVTIDLFTMISSLSCAPHRRRHQQAPDWWRGWVGGAEQQDGRPEQANQTRCSQEKGKSHLQLDRFNAYGSAVVCRFAVLVVFCFVLSPIYSRCRGVVITRRPTSARSLLPPSLTSPGRAMRRRDRCFSRACACSMNFPRLCGLFLVRGGICSIPRCLSSQRRSHFTPFAYWYLYN